MRSYDICLLYTSSVTEQELKVIIEEIEDEGVLEDHESKLVRSALDFDETTAEQVLTPRVDLVSAELNTDNETLCSLCLLYTSRCV